MDEATAAMVVIQICFALLMFGFFIAGCVTWLSHRTEARDCAGLALRICAVYAVATLALLIAAQPESPIVLLMVAWPIDVLRTYVFTALGLYCCATAGIVALPLLQPAIGHEGTESQRSSVGVALCVGVLFAGAWCGYTYVLFDATEPEMSEFLQGLFDETGDDNLALAIMLVAVVAVSEELVFRLGIQNYIARFLGFAGTRYWLAIVLSAALWTIGHTGAVDPAWVKYAQVFPAGLALGWLMRRYGIEACIVAHVLFNVVVASLAHYGFVPFS